MDDHVQQDRLVKAAASGDRAALAQLLFFHHDSLRAHISRQLASGTAGASTVDDVLQQTFVRAALAVHCFEQRADASFAAWLKTIATNLIRDIHRRRNRERRAGPGEWADDGSMGKLIDLLSADATPPMQQAQRRESIRRMRASLASLPADQRELLERYYLQGESLEQIATSTGRTKEAVRGICYRARKNLRGMMGGSSLYFSG